MSAQQEVQDAAQGGPEGKQQPALDAWSGVGLLSLAWSCNFSTLTATIATVCLAGQPFAPSPQVETLPLACLFYSTAAANLTLPFEVHRVGRRGTYLLGAGAGMAGSAGITLAIFARSFALLCAGSGLIGASVAHAMNYRYAAVSMAPSNPPKAISCVLLGGVAGAGLGPGALAHARHLLPVEHSGVYMLCAAMHAIAAGLLCRVKFPRLAPCGSAGAPATRRLLEIFAQPRCWAATFAMTAAYAAMMLIMAPTPLVMRKEFGHSYGAATLVMTTHMVLMYAPSTITGHCIRRHGTVPVLVTGCAVTALSAGALLAGSSLPWFFVGLGLLGVGWNLLFVPGTAQLASTYQPAEGPKVQALSDTVVFMASGTSSLGSAVVVKSIGWDMTQVAVMAFAAVTAAIVSIPPLIEALSQQKPEEEPA